MIEGRDRLTGLLTRRDFEDHLQVRLQEAGIRDGLFSIAFLDLDHFKRFNDTLGHETGDTILRRSADVIRDGAGNTGVAARYGGEEFILLLPGLEREQAFLMVERIRAELERTVIDGVDAPVTLSAGVAGYPTDGQTESEIMRKADQALYRAKSTGRNKVCIAQEERMAPKTTHYTLTQIERLAKLAKEEGLGEATLLREALDDLLFKYKVSDVES
jgi:diguanylate cyclase (GGDEF)-like protein